MKTYKINKCLYVIRDFTFNEQEKVLQIQKEIAQLEDPEAPTPVYKVKVSEKRMAEIFSFILETEDGEIANLTVEDLKNTGMRVYVQVITDFILREIEMALEKKRYLESSMKELNMPIPNSNPSPKLTRTISRRK